VGPTGILPVASRFRIRISLAGGKKRPLSASFAWLDHPAPDAPDLGMMGEHMDAAVASTKERTEQPAHDGNYNRAEKCAPKAGNLETWQYLANEFQHQRIDDQNEDAQRDEN
jgi:hypothetical protein